MFDEQKIQSIIDECNQHNADISDDEPREPERVRSDAEYIFQLRSGMLSQETMAMMLTDYKFALRKAPRHA